MGGVCVVGLTCVVCPVRADADVGMFVCPGMGADADVSMCVCARSCLEDVNIILDIIGGNLLRNHVAHQHTQSRVLPGGLDFDLL